MKTNVSPDDTPDTEDEQTTTNNQTTTGMEPPEAAARSELKRVEAEAHQKANEEAAAVHSELRQEIEARDERIDELEQYVTELDRAVNFLYQQVDGVNSDLVHVVPENREEDAPENVSFVEERGADE